MRSKFLFVGEIPKYLRSICHSGGPYSCPVCGNDVREYSYCALLGCLQRTEVVEV